MDMLIPLNLAQLKGFLLLLVSIKYLYTTHLGECL